MALPAVQPRTDLPSLGERRARSRSERDLALLGRIALILDPVDPLNSLDDVLDVLRSATRAESAEVFLLDPTGNELVLTLQRGEDAGAFAERSRFDVSSGYPGLAVFTGRSIETRRLADDDRFLRGAVKEAGYRSFISVPIGGSRRVLGTLDLAWKRDDVDFERVGRLMAWLSRPVGTAVLAAAAVRARRRQGDPADAHERLRQLTHADEVTLMRILPRADDADPDARPGDGLWDLSVPNCAASRGARVLLGDPSRWKGRCLTRCGEAGVRYCVPLERDGEVEGIARLSYHQETPWPPTRHLIESLTAAEDCTTSSGAPLIPLSAIETPTPPPPLEIRCFGGFEVRLDGEPLAPSAFSRKKAADLLQLLALKPGLSVTGAQLTRLLWPGVDPEAGKNRLHGVVHALRRALEPQKGRHAGSWIVCSKDRYSLAAPPGTVVDLWRFRECMAQARSAEGKNAPADVVTARLQEAVELYAGELLAGNEDTVWTIDPRSRCREQYIDALLRLERYRLEAGGEAGDVGLLRSAVAADPLREDIHLRLIRTLLDAGRRGDALEQYKALVRVLREELDARPSLEARRLRSRLCDG